MAWKYPGLTRVRNGERTGSPGGGTYPSGKMTLGVLLYDNFEPLDVFGPVEMFMNIPKEQLEIAYIAEEAGPVLGGSGGGQRGPKVYAKNCSP